MSLLTPRQRAAAIAACRGGASFEVAAKKARIKVSDLIAEASGDAQFRRDLEGPPAGFAEVAKVSAGLEAKAVALSTAKRDPEESDAFARVRDAAAELAPGHLGTLLWIDKRCQGAKMHALDAWWIKALGDFYETAKMVFAARVGLRGAKSVSICRTLVNDALFTVRSLDPGTVGVIPVMSSDRTEATDRFHTIRKILRAAGVSPSKPDDSDGDIIPAGLGTEYTAGALPSGGGVIRTTDSQGHQIEFRIYPARITGAIGYTGIGGFADEVDIWADDLGTERGLANPAEVVLDRLFERFTTQPTARLYVVSASYKGESAHARKIREGDTMIQYVARLGGIGAERDTAARASLAALIHSNDPRLLAPADPLSTDVGAWVSNPASPIERCYALSRERLGPMFGRYGGRPDEAVGVRGPLAGVSFSRAAAAPSLDTVIGMAPGPEWGIVLVSATADGLVVRADLSGPTTAHDALAAAQGLGASVLVTATSHEDAVRGEAAAWLSGRGSYALPPVTSAPCYDGPILRVGPLMTLYQRERLRHAGPLADLEAAIRAHSPGARSPRLEALCAALARLLACYPHVGTQSSAEPPRMPKARETLYAGRRDD